MASTTSFLSRHTKSVEEGSCYKSQVHLWRCCCGFIVSDKKASLLSHICDKRDIYITKYFIANISTKYFRENILTKYFIAHGLTFFLLGTGSSQKSKYQYRDHLDGRQTNQIFNQHGRPDGQICKLCDWERVPILFESVPLPIWLPLKLICLAQRLRVILSNVNSPGEGMLSLLPHLHPSFLQLCSSFLV